MRYFETARTASNLSILTDDSTVSCPRRYPCEAQSIDCQPGPWKHRFSNDFLDRIPLPLCSFFDKDTRRGRRSERKRQKAYNFNTSRGTSCAAGRSNRFCLQQDTDLVSGWHLHGPSAQISQSSSAELICQTANHSYFRCSWKRLREWYDWQKRKKKNRGKRRKFGRDKKLRLPGCSTALSLLSRRDKRFSSSSRIVIATLPSAEIVPVTISDSVSVVADRSKVDSECAQSREVSGRGLQFARERVAESTSNNRTTRIILVGSKSFLFLEAPGSFDSSRQLSSHVRSTIRSPLASLHHSRKGFRFVFPLIVADFRVTLEIDKQWWSF